MPSKELVLTTVNLMRLLDNAALVAAFPFLAAAKRRHAASANSGPCGCRKTKDSVDWGQIRTVLAAMPEASKAKFKELAGVDTVVILRQEGGQVRTIKF